MRSSGFRFFCKIIFVLASFPFIEACNFQHDKTDSSAMRPTFEKIRTAVLGPMCLRCHSPSDSLDLSSYAALMKSGMINPFHPEKSQFLDAIETGRMPKDTKRRIAPTYIEAVRKWIAMGAPEREGKPPAPVEKPTPTFAYIQPHIFAPKCATCHCPGTKCKYPEFDMSTYEAMMASGLILDGKPDDSDVYLKIKNKEMPPRKLPKLSDEERDLVRDWIKLGAKK